MIQAQQSKSQSMNTNSDLLRIRKLKEATPATTADKQEPGQKSLVGAVVAPNSPLISTENIFAISDHVQLLFTLAPGLSPFTCAEAVKKI